MNKQSHVMTTAGFVHLVFASMGFSEVNDIENVISAPLETTYVETTLVID